MNTPRTSASVLDWRQLDLVSPGRSLIEASAGTGKTWTISVLYLRLLLERQLSSRQIVVTTFTDAAAQELRERLRARLVWAEAQARGGSSEAPAESRTDLAWLHARWHVDPAQAERDRLRLRLAQAELDLAPVGTLHSLCRRILTDYPFESGGGFALGELVSSDALLDEWSEDLWRQLQQGDGPSAAAAPDSLQKLRGLLKAYLQPGVALWAPDEAALRELLPAEQASVLEAFAQRSGIWALTPKTGKDKASLKNALNALALWLRDRATLPSDTHVGWLLEPREQLDPAQCDELLRDPALVFAAMACHLLRYHARADHVRAWQRWLAQVGAWREERLAARGQLTFDALIGRVREALARPGNALAERLHAAWPVALVDEFQDTDAQQYDILHAIYSHADGSPRGRLVMIGDPKQAIYRFRGGDIHTYLRAAASAAETLRLDVNQRSSRAYVAATNQFYALAGTVLSARADGPIAYEAVRASGRRDGEVYTVDGVPLAQPLRLHFNADCPPAVAARTRAALQACARQIAGLLQSGTHRIGDRLVQPGDLAVLLPGNADIVQLRALLQQLNVPCVGAGRSSVFQTSLARELQVLLYGVEHAHDEGAVRAALATRLYGMRYNQLMALREQPEAWAACEQQFVRWRQTWQRDGVLAVVRELSERAAPGLLAGNDGERALTDLRHLGELLQARAEQLPGAEQLLAWLARQRDGEPAGGDAADEQQLRIESDADRVRLLTLHASKGLEFPIVFLPLMWDHTRNAQDSTPVVDEPLCGQRVIGFGEAAKARYHAEGQDERFRVLYVALTRAIHACHVYVLPPDRPRDATILKSGESCAPLRDPVRAPLDASIEKLLACVASKDPGGSVTTVIPAKAGTHLAVRGGNMDDQLSLLKSASRFRGNDELRAEERPESVDITTITTLAPNLAWLADDWAWQAVPLETDAQTSVSRTVLPLPPAHPDARVYSFSTLIRSAHGGQLEDQAASDEADAAVDSGAAEALLAEPAPAVTTEHPQLLALAAIRGADFGNAMHAMFEHRTLGQPMTAQGEFIDRWLHEFGVRLEPAERAAFIARLARRLQATLDTPLLPGLTLGSLPASRQLAEMEFHYLLDDASVAVLRQACARHGEPALVPFTASHRLRGRMTGKIDLIVEHAGRYLVLDYKSNWLGNAVEAYLPDALDAAMEAHQYRFQALLYTVALDRMLRQRLRDYRREQHLGEAIYLFVRGVGLAPDAGIWRHRFDPALIEAVDAVLAGATEAIA